MDTHDKANRVARGGAWSSWIDINLRLDFRWYSEPAAGKNTIGFRCLLVNTGSN